MRDFAKNTSVVDRELAQPVGEWKLDAASVLFGILLGAIVVFAGFKASSREEIKPNTNVVSEDTAEEASVLRFEFYEMLKRDDLYPAGIGQVK